MSSRGARAVSPRKSLRKFSWLTRSTTESSIATAPTVEAGPGSTPIATKRWSRLKNAPGKIIAVSTRLSRSPLRDETLMAPT